MAPKKEEKTSKHAAAVTLGHYGGEKGGQARAEKLNPKERTAIARKGGKARQSRA